VRRRALLAALLIGGILLPMQCREAVGVDVDPLAREAEEALVEYLRIDTTNPPGNETAGATFLRDLLQKEGIDARLVGDDPARQAVYARLSSGSNEKALVLLSHIDVVPADPAAWTHPPFAAAREGGYLWGRGALDIKSLTIAQLMTLVDLKRRGAVLTRDVIFLAVPDEERGGLLGTKTLLEKHPELFENAGVVINEGGSNETAVDKVIFWGIEVDQKIPLWLRIVAEGEGGHAAGASSSGGAATELVHALYAIDQIPTPYRLSESVAHLTAVAAAARTDGRGRLLRLIREPLDVERIEKELPAGYQALLRDTISITHIRAGHAVNVVPDRAFAEVDIRLVPGSDPKPMLESVRTAVGDRARVEVLLEGEAVAASPHDTPLFAIIARAMKNASPGSTVAPVVGVGATDSRFFRARGITAYGIAPFKVNYYDAAGVHGTDERIRVRFFAEGVTLMREIVSAFCAKQ
jgi:acetylornithine deacetylase/succinyl-diaminopimelate desuccinylase-like protein